MHTVCVSDDSTHLRRALTAAHLYYVQLRTMDAIAAELGTSRSTVSRLLSFARAEGIVEVRVRSPLDAPGLVETQLRRQFGVRAQVIPVPESVSDLERLDRVAQGAAQLLDELIVSDLVVGIAWGSTLAAVARRLTPKRVHGTTFVQLNGSGNVKTSGITYASELLSRFSTAYGGDAEQFPVPAFFDDPETRRALWRERSTRRILDIQSRMGLVLFSVGAFRAEVPSRVHAGDYLEPADLEQLKAERVVGDVATVFYRANGSTEGIALNDRGSGPSFDLLRAVPRRCCIVTGEAKIPSLRGALAAGLITDLVIDERTARAMVDGREAA